MSLIILGASPDTKSKNAAKEKRSRRWKLLFSLYMVAVIVLVPEITLRIFYATKLGPRMLLYGTAAHRRHLGVDLWSDLDRLQRFVKRENQFDTVEKHHNQRKGYSKYFPNEVKYHQDVDTGEMFIVGINQQGFRGADFKITKEPDVIRIVTLGASSTFGFYNRDNETYPYQLEKMLNERCMSKRFEVINLGIPHSTSDQILAIFMAEALPLEPDIVTFYEGRNDSQIGGRQWLPMPYLAGRFLTVRLAGFLMSSKKSVLTADEIEQIADRRSNMFLSNLNRIAEECRRSDILFIPATEQASSNSVFGAKREVRERLRGVTMAEEVRKIRLRLESDKPITRYEAMLLIHDHIQNELRNWAYKESLPLVDTLKHLDQDRHHLLTWVHLDREGNAIIAGALADAILKQMCSM